MSVQHLALGESFTEFFNRQIRLAKDVICVAETAKTIARMASSLPDVNENKLAELMLKLGNCDPDCVIEYVEAFTDPWNHDDDPNVRNMAFRILNEAKKCRPAK